MNSYKITLIISEENIEVLTEALTSYKGSKKLIADTMSYLIKRQVEIQKGSKEE